MRCVLLQVLIITKLGFKEMDIKAWIQNYEGFNPFPYEDSVGKLTIGFGRNIEDNGLSYAEAQMLFDNDYRYCEMDLANHAWYVNQPDSVKAALMNMCFNLGMKRLLGFKKMLAALIDKDYTKAAIEALDSQWAKQVGQRAKDCALMLSEGSHATPRTD
jgi:lysozyme